MLDFILKKTVVQISSIECIFAQSSQESTVDIPSPYLAISKRESIARNLKGRAQNKRVCSLL